MIGKKYVCMGVGGKVNPVGLSEYIKGADGWFFFKVYGLFLKGKSLKLYTVCLYCLALCITLNK